MKLTIDDESGTLRYEWNGQQQTVPLYSNEGFQLLSREWLKVGWNEKHTYTFTWLGRPIIQLSEDLMRAQEVIYKIQPDTIIETGVAHGGSLIFWASVCELIGKGRVIGVDIEIRPHNREAIEQHRLSSRISLIEGDSVDKETVQNVREIVDPGDCTLVFLDSNHTKQHVLAELDAYHSFVSPGSYIVATDGLMRDLSSAPRGSLSWEWDNPASAAREFLSAHPEFALDPPSPLFNESILSSTVTHWPEGWLRRVSATSSRN